MTSTTTKPERYTVTVSDRAAETITAMVDHVEKIGNAFGRDTKRYREADKTLLQAVRYLFGTPMTAETTISKDGDLSLFITSSFMVYGCIFHGEHRVCEDPHCKAIIKDDGTLTTFSGRREDIVDHVHTPSYPLDYPTPGTWSFHS